MTLTGWRVDAPDEILADLLNERYSPGSGASRVDKGKLASMRYRQRRIHSLDRSWIPFFAVALLLSITSASCSVPPSSSDASATNTAGVFSSPTSIETGPSQSLQVTHSGQASIHLKACVTAHALNVRAGPGIGHKIIGGISNSKCILIDARNASGEWIRIKSSEWQNAPPGGWVSAYYLKITGNVTALPIRQAGVSPSPTRIKDMPTAEPPTSGSGPTALCNDGTYSYSQHRRGTCSWHGGVREWLRDDIPP